MTRPLYEPSEQREIAASQFASQQLFRRPSANTSGNLAIYEIKVFDDASAVTTGDDAFVWEIPEDLDASQIVKVEAYISTAGGSATTVNIRAGDPCDTGTDILTTPITIDTGECNSKDASVQPVIDGGAYDVAWGDHLHIDVDANGGGYGLGVIVTLVPSPIGSVTLAGAQGPQGPPGGITNWTGEWDSGTTYAMSDAVSHNGTSYVAIQASTNVEPGVDTGWEDYWMVLAEAGADGTTSSVTFAVSQTGHGFSVGDVVRLSGSTYVAAQADTRANAAVVGMVSAVAGADDFTLQTEGHVTGLSSLTAGTVYYLSPSSAGALINTAPTGTGQVSKPMFIADTTTSGFITTLRGLLVPVEQREFTILVTDPNGSAITTGDGQAYMPISAGVGGLDLIEVAAVITTVSSSGLPTVQIHNVTQSADMLSTKITIDVSEFTSYTAATPPVIDTSNDDVATGDILRVDIDVAGTGAKGLMVILTFGLA